MITIPTPTTSNSVNDLLNDIYLAEQYLNNIEANDFESIESAIYQVKSAELKLNNYLKKIKKNK